MVELLKELEMRSVLLTNKTSELLETTGVFSDLSL